ncbi:fer-1-like protein 5 [Aix galericulata]|nr:fer-1-like protein 5 [Aix galericulata]
MEGERNLWMGGAGTIAHGDTGIWREQNPGTLGCRVRGIWGQQGQADPLPHIPTPQGTEAAVPEGEQPASGAGGRGRLQQPVPLILCTFQRPSYFQLRCYLFQALELAPHGTKTTAGGTPTPPRHPGPPQQAPRGADDPVAHVSFVHVSQSTRVLARTLDPRWDQALLFHRVLLYGDPQGVRDEPPAVVVEVFDKGEGAGSLLGRCVCTPHVWLDLGCRQPPRLRRYPLEGLGGPAGELLAAFELLHEAEVRGEQGGEARGHPEPVPIVLVPPNPIRRGPWRSSAPPRGGTAPSASPWASGPCCGWWHSR